MIDLTLVTEEIRTAPHETVALWEGRYRQQVEDTAKAVLAHRVKSPVVLLSGPSGSGKTTTGQRLKEALERMGAPAHLISMDNYYVDWDLPDFPRTPDGERDMESPYCLNIPLLNRHFSLLESGEEIFVPIYDFPTHKPLEGQFIPMSPAHGDIFIFEGIHALNPLFTTQHPEAFRLYVSPASSFGLSGQEVCPPRLLRLMRRTIRDRLFRGAEAEFTLSLWRGVMAGDRMYVEPHRESAHRVIDTTLGYELFAMKPHALELFLALPREVSCRDMVEEAIGVLSGLPEIPREMIPKESILREFLG